MSVEIRVPGLPGSVRDATLVTWHKQAGQPVESGECVADLETDKVVLEVAAPARGVLAQVRAGHGDLVTSGQVLALVDDVVGEPAVPAAPPPAVPDSRPRRRVPMSRIRQRIGERLLQAQNTQALVTTVNEVDMSEVRQMRARYEERLGGRLGLVPFFVKAAIAGLRRFPAVNAAIDGTDIVYHDFYDIGVAVSTGRGLLVPVVRDADRRSFTEIEQEIAAHSERARRGVTTLDDLTGGTFTISNGGVFGSLLSTPIVNPPQCAILGMHRVEDRPVVRDGAVAIRPMMYVAVTYDHRLVDGSDAVQFLGVVKECLEEPRRLLAGA